MKTTLCHHHGCYKKAEEGKHFCPEHIEEEERWKKRPVPKRKKSNEWHGLYNSARWRNITRAFLLQYPYCFRCGKEASIADHIVPHRGDTSLFYDMNNLQPMCQKCHSAKTMRENNYYKSVGGRGSKILRDWL